MDGRKPRQQTIGLPRNSLSIGQLMIHRGAAFCDSETGHAAAEEELASLRM